MWSKNAIKCLVSYNCRSLYLSGSVLSGPVQKTSTRVKEYTDTPKPPRQRVKKFKEPFPKGFFVGKCDPEVLEYPEVLKLEEIEKINQFKSQIQAVADEIDSNAVDSAGSVPKSYLQNLSEFQLFGAKCGLPYGGHDFTETETLFVNEAVAFDGSVSKLINEQQQLCGALLHQYGTEDQKERYLKPLIYGETSISGAFLEHMSVATILGEVKEAIALPDGEGGFEITGPKKWVYNAPNADAFIVFALTNKQDEKGQRVQGLTAFIIPADAPGVTVLPPDNKFALRGVPVCQLELNNVRVNATALLGKKDEAFDMLTSSITAKFNIAPVAIGLGKRILNDVTHYAINSNFLGQPMIEIDGVQTRLGKIAMALYSLESAAYLQAGHVDLYENADQFVEMCILKVLSSETLRYILDEALQILGVDSQNREEFQYIGRILRDASFYATCDESDANVKMMVGLKGLQHAGMLLHDEVRKTRNPFNFPKFIVKRMYQGNTRYGGDGGQLKLGLDGYVHPSLQKQAHTLEYCISRIFMCSESLLTHYGREVFEKHLELEALGDLTIATYSLVAVLGRASRSYCIGLSESECEMEIAYAMTTEIKSKVDQLVPLIMEKRPTHNVHKLNRISTRVIANKGCFTESPIARNF